MSDKGTCQKHGETNIWVVCRHVGSGNAGTVIFSEKQDALCFECADNFQILTEKDVVGMCEGCLKDFTAKLMINSQSFANLQSRIVGVEHLKGKWSDANAK